MMKKRVHWKRGLAVAALCAGMALSGCASQKAGSDAPELPAKHWLDNVPGVPVENKGKLEAVIPNLYDPAKKFSFEDCVFLTIQQSPLLVNSAVELEIKRLALTDAVWRYLPEPRMTVEVGNTLTYYNAGKSNVPDSYGRVVPRIGFYARFPNPVESYFNHQAQKIMVNLAISTHRKAVGEAIYKVAQSYLRLEAKGEILRIQKEMAPLARETTRYWEQLETADGRQGVALNVAQQHEREVELTGERMTMEEVMERTSLKILAGVEPQQRLNIDARSANDILRGFNGKDHRWEDRWLVTEDNLLLRSQIRLGDYNIMLAWAEYVPDMTIRVDKNPPAGQYQPPDGREDYFWRLTFDFPLIDWNRRYRGVQRARMQKAQAFHELSRKRTDYSNTWLQCEQRVALAETNRRLARVHFETAEMHYKEARISFETGLGDLPAMSSAHESMVQSRIKLVEAELEHKLANLEWMYVANLLQERFLGLPAKEIEK